MAVLIDPNAAEARKLLAGLGREYAVHLALGPDAPALSLNARAERSMRKPGGILWGLSFLEKDERDMGSQLEVIRK